VPLLFEGGFEKDFDAVLVVERDKNIRIEAIQQRNQLSEEEAKVRINAQFDHDAPQNKSYLQSIHAYNILNNGTICELKERVSEVLKEIQKP
jgi:dephospho-CoA kinase